MILGMINFAIRPEDAVAYNEESIDSIFPPDDDDDIPW